MINIDSDAFEKSFNDLWLKLEDFQFNQIVFESKVRHDKDTGENHRKFRGSKYRGVSLNGKNWQVFIVINKSKCYAGCVDSELKAAALYDKLAILFHGDKVGDQ